MSRQELSQQNQPDGTVSTGRLAFTWALVGVPLAYGVYETLRGASQLFTG